MLENMRSMVKQKSFLNNDVAGLIDSVDEKLKKYVETGLKEPTEMLLDELIAMCNAVLSSNCAQKAQVDRLSKHDAATSRLIGLLATDTMADVVEQISGMHQKQTAAANMMAELAVLNSQLQATTTKFVTTMSKMAGELPEP